MTEINDDVKIDNRVLKGNPVVTGQDTMGRGLMYRRTQGIDAHVLVYTVWGQGFMGALGSQLEQPAGRITIADPGVALNQDVMVEEGWRRVWVIFEPRAHWYGWMDWPEPVPGYRVLDVAGGPIREQMLENLVKMHRHAVSGVRAGHALAMNALEAALIMANEGRTTPAGTGVDARMERALAYIGEGIAGKLTLAGVAKSAHVSTAQLSRLFRARVGRSVMAYVEQQRVIRACQLLEMTSRSISEIAGEVGYEDAFYFSTRFRKAMGVSPGGYRKGNDGVKNTGAL